MALGFSSGLLTGLQQFGQGGGVPSDPRQRNAIQAAGVTNPLLQQFGMGLGGLFGNDMRSPAEIEKEKQAQAMDVAFKASTQGTASAQQGNVAAVRSQINALQQAMSATTDLSAKKLYGQQIEQLTSMIPAAQEIEVSNNAKSILSAEQAIAGGVIENEQARRAMQARVDELKKDPEVMREYNNFKMQEWKTQRAQQDMEADAWVKTNGSAITQALKDDDFDEVTRLVTSAGDYTEAAQAYVNRAQQNIKAMNELEEKSIERKTAPSVDMWEEKINTLPEEARKSFVPILKAYKNAAKGWNENTQTWKTGARRAATKLEKDMTGLYRNMINQVAVSDYSMKRREEAKKAEQIKALELKINSPMDSSYVTKGRILASSLLDKKEELTMPLILRAAESLYAQDQEMYKSQLSTLNGDPQPEEQSNAPPIGTVEAGYEFIGGDPNDPNSWKEVTTNSDGAFGTDYMSTESLAPERAYLERIRSNISPLGTYTQ